MGTDKLTTKKAAHAPLSYPRRLVRKFGAVIGELRCVVNRVRDQFSMRDVVASQLIRDNLPGFTTIISSQPFEKPPSSCAVSTCLQKHINDFTILIDRTPKIVLLALDRYQDLINKEGITLTLMAAP